MFYKLTISVMCVLMVMSSGCTAKTNKTAAKKIPQASQAQPVSGQINWLYDLQGGLAAAKQSNKPLMVDFFAEWCGWCKKLDAEVYTNKDIITLSEKFICVKVDTDKDQANAQKYGVRGLPTIVFMNSDGNAINTIVGYRDSAPFLEEMNKALGK
jgi:thiol:disulfide interchange protein